jgi:hypothetical protein
VELSALPILIWFVLGLAVVWVEPRDRGGRVTPDEAELYNRTRAF